MFDFPFPLLSFSTCYKVFSYTNNFNLSISENSLITVSHCDSMCKTMEILFQYNCTVNVRVQHFTPQLLKHSCIVQVQSVVSRDQVPFLYFWYETFKPSIFYTRGTRPVFLGARVPFYSANICVRLLCSATSPLVSPKSVCLYLVHSEPTSTLASIINKYKFAIVLFHKSN